MFDFLNLEELQTCKTLNIMYNVAYLRLIIINTKYTFIEGSFVLFDLYSYSSMYKDCK